jgi:hypothetical protein
MIPISLKSDANHYYLSIDIVLNNTFTEHYI